MCEEKDTKYFLVAVGRLWFIIKRLTKNKIAETNLNLTLEQIIVLHSLEKLNGMNITQLADITDRDNSTTSRMINGLEKRNLVLRVPDQNDSRQKKVYLTNQSKEILADIKEVGLQIQQMLMEGLDSKEFEKTAELLNKISDKFDIYCEGKE